MDGLKSFLSKKLGTLSFLLLIPDLTAESAIPASARWMKKACVSQVPPQIFISSEAPRFAFIPPANGSIISRGLDFRFSEIDAEILESSMSEANRFTVRTRGKSPSSLLRDQ